MKSIVRNYTYCVIEDVEDVIIGILNRMKKYKNWKSIGESREIKSALNLVKEHHPDLIFMDWSLKGGSTYEILEYIKKNKYYAPYIIFFTAFQKDEPTIPEIVHNKYKVDKYLLKPIWRKFSGNLEQYLKEASSKSSCNTYLEITDVNKNIYKINTSHITSVSLYDQKKRTKTIRLLSGEEIIVKNTFQEIEEILIKRNIDFIYTHKRYSIVIKNNIEKFEEGYVFFYENKSPKVEVCKENIKNVTNWLINT
ncbi:response regulator [Weeksellaceae bacterium TAE3-ERU29]|nr:response regulator [Weeksellaceae bacterium TAE3-ERU29]